MRPLLLPTLALLAHAAGAQEPTLRALLDQRQCPDTACATAFAMRQGFCGPPQPYAGLLEWRACTAKRGVSPNTMIYALSGSGGDQLSVSYAVCTRSAGYAERLLAEVRSLGFLESSTFRISEAETYTNYTSQQFPRTFITVHEEELDNGRVLWRVGYTAAPTDS